jgi:hypothetical protein
MPSLWRAGVPSIREQVKTRRLMLVLMILAVLGIVLSALYLSGPATPY